MTRTSMFVAAAITGVAAINYGLLAARHDANPAPVSPSETRAAVVAGPGRVEALSEEVRVSAQVGGRLQAVLVDETDAVKAGQVLAVIENAEYRARVKSAEASLQLRQAEARRVHNGARDQERRDAAAVLREAEAVLDNAQSDVVRKRDLFRETVISRSELDNAEQQIRVSQAKVDSARERLSLLEAGSRDEDIAKADADVALAAASLAEARAMLEKTFVRAPIDGVILHRHRRVGESVSTQFDSPIVTLADRTRVRVRVDVDETDVARLRIGQSAYVTADAFAGRRFSGKVVRVGQRVGKKTVRTDEPGERIDTNILETLIELGDDDVSRQASANDLPLGLRVQAFITTGR
jgi:HlyD family secretion protein